jgi:hypothetical protein
VRRLQAGDRQRNQRTVGDNPDAGAGDKHIHKFYACKAYETAPVTADKPQLIKKSLTNPSVQAMLLTTKYAGDIPRQTLAR